jgi:GT2 family glycosyltransferase
VTVVSIVIPVWNRAELTRPCLDALRATVDWRAHELIVVDNHSTDDTPALLAEHPLAPRVIRNEENKGFARACNQGAAAARGEFVLFLNNDTVPEPGWLDPLIEVLRAEPDVAAVGSRLLYPDSRLIQHAGIAIDSLRDALQPFHLWWLFPADWPAANVRRDVVAVTAACVLVRRSAFEQLGGFDESYRNGFEDVDLCLRLAEKRQRIVYCPESVVLHYESMTEGRALHEDANFALFRERWSGRLGDRVASRRDLILAAFDEVFRVKESGARFVARIDQRLFRYNVRPPVIQRFRSRVLLEVVSLWWRLRHFASWRRAARRRAELGSS